MADERTAASFLDNLRASGLLGDAQLAELGAAPEARDPAPAPLARVVLRRGWLTRFQLNAIAAGRGKDLAVGPYLILDRLGEGGMGMVYKARHQHMQRVVALKVIRKEKLASPEAVKRFYQEVQLAAALQHPNIVLAYDAAPAGSNHYFAMEYVEGVDLARLVRERGRLPAAQACDYVRQAALGLQHAHEKGLVHRDVKPANLLVSRTPEAEGGSAARGDVVKLLDMGLARLQGGGDTGMTRHGAVIGTPDYIAPEQAMDSKSADIRADLYSLGCTLHYLLTGKPPFPAKELTEVLLKHQMQKPTPLDEQGVEAPDGVQEILDTLMAKDPADRYQTPAELADALAPFCREATLSSNVFDSLRRAEQPEEKEWASLTHEGDKDKGPPSRTVELPRRGDRKAGKASRDEAEGGNKRVLVLAAAGAAGGLLLVVAALGAFLWWRSRHTPEPLAQGPPPPTARADAGPGPDTGKPAPPPGGENPAPPPGGEKPVPPPGGEKPPAPLAPQGPFVKRDLSSFEFALAADGGIIASLVSPNALRVETVGGRHLPGIESNGATIDAFALTPDGGRVVVAFSDRAIAVVRIGEAKPQHVLKGHTEPIKCLAVSPDGRTALSGGGKEGGIDTAIRVWDLDGGTELGKLQGHEATVERVAFSPDGKRAVSVGADSLVRVWDVPGFKELVRLDALKSAEPLCAAFSPDGNRLLVGDRGGNLTLVAAATGRQLRRFPAAAGGPAWDVAFTPDGTRAVVARGASPAAARGEVGVWGVERAAQYLTNQFHMKSVRRVIVADRGRVAYSSGDDGLLVRNDIPPLPDNLRVGEAPPPAGDSGTVIVAANKLSVLALAFSPDGKRFVLGDGRAHLWDVESRKELHDFGGAVLTGPRGGGRALVWSDDGRRVLAAGGGNWMLLDADKGTVLKTFTGHTTSVRAIAVSPDGRQALTGAGDIVFQEGKPLKGPDGKFVYADTDVRLWDLATGDEVRRYSGPTSSVEAVGFSADGKRVFAVPSSADHTACYAWDVDKPAAPEKPPFPQGWQGRAFSPDRREIALAQSDVVRICSLETGKELRHSEKLPASSVLAWSRDGRYLVWGGATLNSNGTNTTGPVRLLDAATCKVLKEFTGLGWSCSAVDVTSGGRYVLGAAYGSGVRLWDRGVAAAPPEPPADKAPFAGHAGGVLAVAFSPDGKQIVSAGKDQTVRVWDVATGQEVMKLTGLRSAPHAVGFAAKGKEVVVTSLGGARVAWEIQTGKVLLNMSFGQHRTDVISPDGERVLVPRGGSRVEVFPSDEAGMVHGVNGSWDGVAAAAFAADGHSAVFVGGDNLLHVIDLRTEKEVGKGFPGLKGEVTCLAINPKGTHILTAADDKAVTLWKLPAPPVTTALGVVHTFKGHKDKVNSLAFAPDGKHVVTGGEDATVRVWDLQGKEVAQSAEHKEAVRCVAFSPDGKTIVSCGDGIKVWEWQPKAPAKP